MDCRKADINLVELRFAQIERYFKLKGITKIIQSFTEISQELKLSGDFNELNTISSMIQNENKIDKELREINVDDNKLLTKLQSLNEPKKIECLEAFITNISFVKWLQGNVKSINDLRLLAEFAAESENEGALEARRVQTLTLVVTSYAPLIYDLKKDAGLNDLIHQADAVCACLNNNPTLPERISAIAKEKTWLEDIKDSRGNTSANSLKQANQINSFDECTGE